MICFHFVTDCDLYDIDSLKNILESNSLILVKWFKDNQMHDNPDIFQAICIGKKNKRKYLFRNRRNQDSTRKRSQTTWCYYIYEFNLV